ncbi:MAG: hypothetical protein M1839_006060 [Geoglossum umbratile]|nr:MAG: hypothetical protein M1839_006060 [Geoglossum umbratile]
MQPSSNDEEFNSHVKRLVEAFEVLNEELDCLRKRIRSMNYTELDIVAKGKISAGYVCQSRGWNLSRARNCRDSHKPSVFEAEQLETDFTTQGKESGLACPFTPMASGSKSPSYPQKTPTSSQRFRNRPPPLAKSKRHSREGSDPITAELHGGSLTSPPPSNSASTSKCPIRYLDQHSPEELAQYFESHKHELPRSHEICVKRFQSNQESIRRLDANYGDLVSMIQGLGIRHKSLLPAEGDDEGGSVEAEQVRGDGRLEQWAESVGETYREADENFVVEEDKSDRGRDRDVNSDRLLKEVRVGESPGRPWGIPIPPLLEPKQVANLSEHVVPTEASGATATATTLNPALIAALPSREASTKRKACPTRHQQPQSIQPPTGVDPSQRQSSANNGTPEPPRTSPTPNIQFKHNAAFVTPSATAVGGNGSPQMAFTGPVFIGFSVEEAMAVLGGWNGGGLQD